MARNRVARVPIHRNAAHNAAFMTAIGGLVINWANNESVFLAMLQCFVRGGSLTAAIVWEAQRTSRRRLELLSRLARESIKDEVLLGDITNAIRQFTGF